MHMYRRLCRAPLSAQRDIQAVHKDKGIKRRKGAVLPRTDFFHNAVCNVRDLESVDVLDSGGNIPLTHAAPVHGKDFPFDGGDITLMFLYDLWLEIPLPITGNVNGEFAEGGFERLFRVAVATVVPHLGAFMGRTAEMVVHLTLECSLKNGGEDLFDRILNLLCVLGLVGFHNLTGDVLCRSGCHFAFCHCRYNLSLLSHSTM